MTISDSFEDRLLDVEIKADDARAVRERVERLEDRIGRSEQCLDEDVGELNERIAFLERMVTGLAIGHKNLTAAVSGMIEPDKIYPSINPQTGEPFRGAARVHKLIQSTRRR